jgi:glutathionylspermidine synthase
METNPKNEYLLPAYFTDNGKQDYAKKPILNNEGTHIEMVKLFGNIEVTISDYDIEGFVYQ